MTFFKQGDVKRIFNDLLQEFSRAELSIINLECPLIHESSPIQTVGPVLGVPEACINGIKEAGIDVVNLANNHIMDHGWPGLQNTIVTCNKFNIGHVGAGEDLSAARKILIREIKGIRIGILSFAEHEFSIATNKSGGANPLNIINFVRIIKAHRDSFDYLIVPLHGGNENYLYPRPLLRDTCRFLVEEGANAVICQHSHCAGSYEAYHDCHIVYGQGNLVFYMPDKNKQWYEGFLIRLEIDNSLQAGMKIIPYVQSTVGGIHQMQKRQEEEFLQALTERSNSIMDDSFIEKQWDMFCRERKQQYLSKIYGSGFLFSRLLNKLAFKLSLEKYINSRQYKLLKLNLIRCQSHRDTLIKILSDELTNIL